MQCLSVACAYIRKVSVMMPSYVVMVSVSVDETRSSVVGLSTTAMTGLPGGSSSLGDTEEGIVGPSSSSSGIVGDMCFAIASLTVGEGGDVLSGDTDAAY